MTLASPALRARWPSNAILVRGWNQTIDLPLWLGGSAVTPTSCVLSIYRDSAKTDLYGSPTVTLGTPSTADTGLISVSEPVSNQWVLAWTPVYGGVSYPVQQRAFLVERMPRPRVDQEDVFGEVSELRQAARIPTGQTTWEPQIQAAWWDVLDALTSAGRAPWLGVDDNDLFRWHRAASVARCCAQVLDTDGAFMALARDWRKRASDLALSCRIEYAATPETRTLVGPSVIPLAPVGRVS